MTGANSGPPRRLTTAQVLIIGFAPYQQTEGDAKA